MGIVQSLFGSNEQPPLKPEGPPPFAQPDPLKRAQVFWLIKKYTSYTNAANQSRIWDEFVDAFEKMIRSREPSEWEIETFKMALDGQIPLHKGLPRLCKGDRSVLDGGSSEGYLFNDCGPQHIPGRRLDEHRWDFWYPTYEEVTDEPDTIPLCRAYRAYNKGWIGFGIAGDSGYSYEQFFNQAHHHALPQNHLEIPEPRYDVIVKTDKPTPLHGIYEPVDGKGYIIGCPNYLLKGKKAPPALPDFGPRALYDNNKTTEEQLQPVIWRLLWEDTRYLDGTVPEEEKDYIIPDAKMAVAKIANVGDFIIARSGQPAMKSGTWAVKDDLHGRTQLTQGEKLPQHNSRDVDWVWVES
jgi:Immunity protein 72/Immunity protein 71